MGAEQCKMGRGVNTRSNVPRWIIALNGNTQRLGCFPRTACEKGVGSNLGSIFRPANFTGSKFDPKLRLDLGFELSPSQRQTLFVVISNFFKYRFGQTFREKLPVRLASTIGVTTQ